MLAEFLTEMLITWPLPSSASVYEAGFLFWMLVYDSTLVHLLVLKVSCRSSDSTVLLGGNRYPAPEYQRWMDCSPKTWPSKCQRLFPTTISEPQLLHTGECSDFLLGLCTWTTTGKASTPEGAASQLRHIYWASAHGDRKSNHPTLCAVKGVQLIIMPI